MNRFNTFYSPKCRHSRNSKDKWLIHGKLMWNETKNRDKFKPLRQQFNEYYNWWNKGRLNEVDESWHEVKVYLIERYGRCHTPLGKANRNYTRFAQNTKPYCK